MTEPTMRQFAARWLTSPLMGLSAGDWYRLLCDNGFRIALRYWPRAALITLTTAATSLLMRIEDARFGVQLAKAEVPAPLIIVGHWRGGTTHLHQLLALAPGLTAPDLYEVMHPHTFLTTKRLLAPLCAPLLPTTRLIDPMPLGIALPQEEEFALALMTRCSPYLAYAFPGVWEHYDRFLTFAGCDAAEQQLWQAALDRFLRKIVLAHGGRPLLKSPASTGRLPILLALYPQAQFVHIARHPFDIFASTKRMLQISIPFMQMERFKAERLDELIVRRYRMMYEAYLRDRAHLRSGQLHELRFEDLVRAPEAQLERLFSRLSLPGHGEFAARLARYLKTISGYRAQSHAPLSPTLKTRLKQEWAMAFAAWDYADKLAD